MIIKVCVGSSCHLKGAPAVIARIQEEIQKQQIEARVIALEACFCQASCQDGVIVLVDDRLYHKVKPEDVPFLLKGGQSVS